MQSPDNNRLHTEHSAGVLPEIACLSCPVNLERYPAQSSLLLMPTPDEIDYQAQVQKFEGNFNESLALRRQLAKMLMNADPITQAGNFNMIAWLAVKLKRYDEAISDSRMALSLYESATPTPDGITATYYAALSAALGLGKQYAEAIRTGERAIELYIATRHNEEYVETHRVRIQGYREHLNNAG